MAFLDAIGSIRFRKRKSRVFKSNGYHCLQSIEPVEGGPTYANIWEAIFLNAVAVLKRSLERCLLTILLWNHDGPKTNKLIT